MINVCLLQLLLVLEEAGNYYWWRMNVNMKLYSGNN